MSSSLIKGSLKFDLAVNSRPTQEHVMIVDRTGGRGNHEEANVCLNRPRGWTAAQGQDALEDTDCPMKGHSFARDKIQSTGLAD